MVILLKTASVQVSSIQIIQVRVQNKGNSVWNSTYDGDVSSIHRNHSLVPPTSTLQEIEVNQTDNEALQMALMKVQL